MSHLTGTFSGIGENPSLIEVELISRNVVELTFSEPMNTALLEETSTYTIDGGVSVDQAELVDGSNDTKVRLTISGFAASTTYNVTVSTSVTDKAGNPLA